MTILDDTTPNLAHARAANWRPGERSKRPKPYGRNWARYQFRVVSKGYGTGRSSIQVRHVPATFPIPRVKAAAIVERFNAGAIRFAGPEDYEPEQDRPTIPPKRRDKTPTEILAEIESTLGYSTPTPETESAS